MSRRTAARLAWSLCGLSVALGALSLLLLMLNSASSNAPIYPYWGADAVTAIVYPFVGALIVARQPRNLVGWVFVLLGLASASGRVANEYAKYVLFVAPGMLPEVAIIAWAASWLGILGFASLPFLFLLFPNGTSLSRRWRPVAWLLLGVITLAVVSTAFMPGPLEDYPAVTNPFGIALAGGALKLFRIAIDPIAVVAAVASIISAFLRYRRSRGEERQQLKWFAYAVALVPLALAGNSVFPNFAWLIGGIGAACIPIGVGIAILKYRLYDIDVLINRTLVYGLLTAALGLVYVGCVVLLRLLLAPLTGSSELAIVASTLAIAVLFAPLRRRIQSLIDKRFYRHKYDAAKVLAAFGATARDETDLERLTGDLLRVVDETMRPEFVGLWLRDTQARSSPKSTSPGSTQIR